MAQPSETTSAAKKSLAARPSRGAARERQTSGWNAVLEIARNRLNRFLALEPEVLQGTDPKAIHDFRVAGRRLQQVLDLLYPRPRPKNVRKLRRSIRRSRRIFSPVRNCDVLIQNVEAALARKRVAQRDIWEAFKDYLEKRRSDGFEKAIGKLRDLKLSAAYIQDCLHAAPQLRSSLESTIPADPLSDEAEVEQFETQVLRELQESWEKLDAQVSKSREDDQGCSLHPARIAAKRFRYLVEVIDELGAPGSGTNLRVLRRLQRHLGDWNDLEVMNQMLAEMLARPDFLRRNIELAIRVEKLMLKNQKAKQVYEKKYFESILPSPGWTRLKQWVNNLSRTPLFAAKK